MSPIPVEQILGNPGTGAGLSVHTKTHFTGLGTESLSSPSKSVTPYLLNWPRTSGINSCLFKTLWNIFKYRTNV